nr:hypothetical protein [Tanacetum cinerariifolium]
MVVIGWQRGDDDDVGGVVVLMKTRRVAVAAWCCGVGDEVRMVVRWMGVAAEVVVVAREGEWCGGSDRSGDGKSFWVRRNRSRENFSRGGGWWWPVEGGVVNRRLWWGLWMVGRRVGASDIVDRIDRKTGSLFWFAGKSPPEKFSGGGGWPEMAADRRQQVAGAGRREMEYLNDEMTELVMDSSGSYHMTHMRDFLYDFKGFHGGSVQLGDNRTCTINGIKKDAKTLFEAIQARFGGNDATKKTQKTLLKQMYENFNAPNTESLDSIFNMLQKIVSQLAILGENISQEDLNMKFLRSLPPEWNTHVVVWRNKPDLKTMSFDDLYNNFKIVEQEVDTATIQVSTVSTPVSIVSAHDNTANLSDATVYAFLANQPNESQLVHEDLEKIHEEDIEEIDLKWQLALLSMRARRECKSSRNQESRPRNQDNLRKTVIVEDIISKAMVAIDGAGFDWSYMADDEVPTNMALMAFSDSEIKIDKFENASKSLDKLIGSQITDNSKTGLEFTSYNAVAPLSTGLFAPPTIDLSSSGLEEFKQPKFESYGPKASDIC